MASTASERRSRVVEALGFWFITLVICAVAGLASYRFGREWIGDRIGGEVKSVLTSDELVDRISQSALEGSGSSEEDEIPEEPPSKAVVEIETAPVTSEDQQRLRLEKARARESVASKPRDSSAEPEADRPAEEDASDAEPAESRSETTSASGVERPAIPGHEVTGSEGGPQYIVRAGSFRKRENAERLVAELRQRGYQPFVTQIVKDGVEYQRVNVARYGDRDRALRLRSELRSEGYDADIATE